MKTTVKLKTFVDPSIMSQQAISALMQAIGDNLGVCEIEPIMYVKMRRDKVPDTVAITIVEKFVSIINRREIYFVGQLVEESPVVLHREEKMIGNKMLKYASFALMHMHLRAKCERIFRRELYKGESAEDVRFSRERSAGLTLNFEDEE